MDRKVIGKNLLAIGIAACAQLALPVFAQEVSQEVSQEVESASDLDVTLSVVEESQNVQDVLNEIEMPQHVREIAEQQMADMMSIISAARENGKVDEEQIEAFVRDAVARSREMMDSAKLSADSANTDALVAAEAAREAVEEAVKNALSGADVQGAIQQMMQDILEGLPEEIRSQMQVDVDALLDRTRESMVGDPQT